LGIFGGVAKAIFVIVAILVMAYYWVQEGEVARRARWSWCYPPSGVIQRATWYVELEGKVLRVF